MPRFRAPRVEHLKGRLARSGNSPLVLVVLPKGTRLLWVKRHANGEKTTERAVLNRPIVSHFRAGFLDPDPPR